MTLPVRDPDAGPDDADLQEIARDRDESSGKTVEINAELPLNGEVGSRALDVLRPGAIRPGAGLELGRTILREARAEYGVYDTKLADETTNTDLVVVNFGTQNTEQVNVPRCIASWRAAPSSRRSTAANDAQPHDRSLGPGTRRRPRGGRRAAARIR